MKVKEIMSRDPVCCGPDDKLTDLAKAMVAEECGAIPVVADKEGRKDLLGIVTDRDIVCRSLAREKDPLAMTAKDCMSQPVVTIQANEDIEQARELMEENLIRRIPVLDDTGFVCGMVTQAHLARKLPSSKTGDLLKKISQPGGAPSSVAAHAGAR